MPRDEDGWYQWLSPTARIGTRYQFRINGKLVVPDPASFFQPDDVGAPSEVAGPLAGALRELAEWLGLSAVAPPERGDLAGALTVALSGVARGRSRVTV